MSQLILRTVPEKSVDRKYLGVSRKLKEEWLDKRGKKGRGGGREGPYQVKRRTRSIIESFRIKNKAYGRKNSRMSAHQAGMKKRDPPACRFSGIRGKGSLVPSSLQLSFSPKSKPCKEVKGKRKESQKEPYTNLL